MNTRTSLAFLAAAMAASSAAGAAEIRSLNMTGTYVIPQNLYRALKLANSSLVRKSAKAVQLTSGPNQLICTESNNEHACRIQLDVSARDDSAAKAAFNAALFDGMAALARAESLRDGQISHKVNARSGTEVAAFTDFNDGRVECTRTKIFSDFAYRCEFDVSERMGGKVAAKALEQAAALASHKGLISSILAAFRADGLSPVAQPALAGDLTRKLDNSFKASVNFTYAHPSDTGADGRTLSVSGYLDGRGTVASVRQVAVEELHFARPRDGGR